MNFDNESCNTTEDETLEELFRSAPRIFKETECKSQIISDRIISFKSECEEITNVGSSSTNLGRKQNNGSTLQQPNFSDESIKEQISELAKSCFLSIMQELQQWMSYLLMVNKTISKEIECTYALVNQILDRTRFSFYYDPSNSRTGAPEVGVTWTPEVEKDLTLKFEYTINHLIELWFSATDFMAQVAETVKLGIATESQVTQNITEMKGLFQFAKQKIKEVIQRSIIITQQVPALVMKDALNTKVPGKVAISKPTPLKELVKCQTSFDLEIKVFTSNTLSRYGGPDGLSKVEIDLVTLEDAERIVLGQVPSLPEPAGSFKNGSPCPFKSVQSAMYSLWTARLKQVRINSLNPTDRPVFKRRYCILFKFKTTQPLIRLKCPFEGNFEVTFNNIFVSLPFGVNVNPSQKADTLANLFWHRAFAPTNTISATWIENPPPVPFPYVKCRLREFFFASTFAKPLSDHQLTHICNRLFDIKSINGETHDFISFDMFWKKVSDVDLESDEIKSFWDWFWNYVMLVGKMTIYWDKGLIIGFISRDNVYRLLENSQVPTLLVKFSDSMKGTLVFCIYLPGVDPQIIYLGLERKLIGDMSLKECYVKLRNNNPQLQYIKRIQTDYNSGATHNIEFLLDTVPEHQLEEEENVPKQEYKKPYSKAEWKLLIDSPILQSYIERNTNFNGDCGAPMSVSWRSSSSVENSLYSNSFNKSPKSPPVPEQSLWIQNNSHNIHLSEYMNDCLPPNFSPTMFLSSTFNNPPGVDQTLPQSPQLNDSIKSQFYPEDCIQENFDQAFEYCRL